MTTVIRISIGGIRAMSFPKMIKVRQHFSNDSVDNIEETVAAEIGKSVIRERIKPGARLAVTVGSRGIANLDRIVAAAVAELKRFGAVPFIVPAMGSHGGAT